MADGALRLYLIPGAGTDRRMFAPQLDRFTNLIIPEWLPPQHRREPLSSYARRLAATIDTSSPLVLGGVSLGGMLAQEMALHLKPLAVIVIAGSGDSRALALWARIAGKITRALPNMVVRGNLKAASWLANRLVPDQVRHKRLYVHMIREMPPELVRWQSGAATEWTLGGPLDMPVLHIHGGRDPIIPRKRVTPQRVIEGGGHLISLTHAEEVNAFIAECLDRAGTVHRAGQLGGGGVRPRAAG